MLTSSVRSLYILGKNVAENTVDFVLLFTLTRFCLMNDQLLQAVSSRLGLDVSIVTERLKQLIR